MVVGRVARLIRLISLLRSTNQALSANQLAAQLGISGPHDEVRMFKLARIVELEPAEERFAPFAS